ncbi:hypothetical protein C8Q80DRAFT_1220000 [Daedaleopsis nitida]|nr:hypothetical protein C8Q80DRAFT_1220000 [Daedaleopsis nitida]
MKQKADDTPLQTAPPAKKARGNSAHAATLALVNSILANPKGYPISGSEDVVRKSLVDLASYARSLELQLAGGAGAVAGSSKAAAAPKPAKSQAELEAAAEKLRKAAVSGIKKQMSVFGVLMNLGGPPTFKMKKFSVEEFENCIGPIEGHVRYDTLFITSKEVTVRWSETGEFKFSGSYGKSQPIL